MRLHFLLFLVLLLLFSSSALAAIQSSDVARAWEFENNLGDGKSLNNLTATGSYSFSTGTKKLGNYSVNMTPTSNYLLSNWDNYTGAHAVSFWMYLVAYEATSYSGLVSTNVASPNSGQDYMYEWLNTGTAYWLNSAAVGTPGSLGAWHHIVLNYDGSAVTVYMDNVSQGNSAADPILNQPLLFGAEGNTGTSLTRGFNGYYDSLIIFNRNLSLSEIDYLWNNGTGISYPFEVGAPILSNFNCTSCNVPNGDTTVPYTTADTTPTFTFNTTLAANCRIGDEDWNHTTMGSSRDCAGGQGNTIHTCSLTVQDELVSSTDYVYISCANPQGNNQSVNSSSGGLQMEITSLDDNTTRAIERGIQGSVIWPGATIYSNQQVYLRNLNNQQVLATADRVAVYGNQRWILNVALDNESALGLFNITPVVYVFDVVNMSITQIELQVATLINATKR